MLEKISDTVLVAAPAKTPVETNKPVDIEHQVELPQQLQAIVDVLRKSAQTDSEKQVVEAAKQRIETWLQGWKIAVGEVKKSTSNMSLAELAKTIRFHHLEPGGTPMSWRGEPGTQHDYPTFRLFDSRKGDQVNYDFFVKVIKELGCLTAEQTFQNIWKQLPPEPKAAMGKEASFGRSVGDSPSEKVLERMPTSLDGIDAQIWGNIFDDGQNTNMSGLPQLTEKLRAIYLTVDLPTLQKMLNSEEDFRDQAEVGMAEDATMGTYSRTNLDYEI